MGGVHDGPADGREPLPLPEINASFVPEETGVESLARQIKMTGRAYPLFDIARLILDGKVDRKEGLANSDSPTNLMWRLQNDQAPVARAPVTPVTLTSSQFREVFGTLHVGISASPGELAG